MVFFALLLCSHQNQSRPWTIGGETYKRCLDCGRKMPYSLEHFRLLTHRERKAAA